MKLLVGPPFDTYRVTSGKVIEMYGGIGDATCGVFWIPVGRNMLAVIAASGEGWDHVSVSTSDRCPTWDEMVAVKRMFFKPDEWAMELHPPEAENISIHKFCLHLWRCWDTPIPLPPVSMIG